MKNRFKVLGIIALAALVGCFVMGCDDGGGGSKDDVTFTLKVENLGTATNDMWGASLMLDGTDLDDVVATASNMDKTTATFRFYVPVEDGVMEGAPDKSKPFTTAGNYYIGLSNVDYSDRDNPDNAFVYLVAGVAEEVLFDDDHLSFTVDKSQFGTAPTL